MPVPAFRVKQTTVTTGTGTLTLIAPVGQFRSFSAHTGATARRVRIVTTFGSNFEVATGEYDGGTPGTVTRANVLASSNGGALVNWGAGTKDVFLLPDLDREVLAISGGATLALADLGNAVTFSGTGSATVNLPAIATVPPGAGFMIRHGGSTGTILTLDPNGAETINGATTFPMVRGEGVDVLRVGSEWQVFGAQTGLVPIHTQSPAAVGQVDFPLPAGFSIFEVTFEGLTPTTNPSSLGMTMSIDGGTSFITSAGAYGWGQYIPAAGPSIGVTDTTDTSARIYTEAQNTAAIALSGTVRIFNARNSAVRTNYTAQMAHVRSGIGSGPQLLSGQRGTNEDNNAIRFSFGNNITAGRVILRGERV